MAVSGGAPLAASTSVTSKPKCSYSGTLSGLTTPGRRACVPRRNALADHTDDFSLVKIYPPGQCSTTYPDMTWVPKESFRAIAAY